MILSDHEIDQLCTSDIRLINPYSVLQLQPASYDVQLDVILAKGIEYGIAYLLQPGQFVLASSIERFNIPNGIVGRLEGKSSLARLGIIIHTAGFIDPGFHGTLTFEITNLNDKPHKLQHEDLIGQVAFIRMSMLADYMYGDPLVHSHYQNQSGPTESYMQ